MYLYLQHQHRPLHPTLHLHHIGPKPWTHLPFSGLLLDFDSFALRFFALLGKIPSMKSESDGSCWQTWGRSLTSGSTW